MENNMEHGLYIRSIPLSRRMALSYGVNGALKYLQESFVVPINP